jgi:hypothetical protein
VRVPGAAFWKFSSTGTEIEGDTVRGNDVQFPWEAAPATAHAPATSARFRRAYFLSR